MKCEMCGKEIDRLEVDMFNNDGSDDWYNAEIYEDNGVIMMNLIPNWTGDELTEEEQVETIRCPHCKKFPFKRKMVDAWHSVSVLLYPSEVEE